MKNKTKIQTLWVALVVLIAAVAYLWKNPRVVTKRVSNPAPPPPTVSYTHLTLPTILRV